MPRIFAAKLLYFASMPFHAAIHRRAQIIHIFLREKEGLFTFTHGILRES
jgi:hypothetical protein